MKLRYSDKGLRRLIWFFIFGITVNLTSGGFPLTAQTKQVFNWDDLKVAYDAYINCPSHENAKALLAALPIKRPEETVGDAERTQLHIFGGANFPVLRAEVQAGDRLAVEIMFRFFSITDGASSETVETMLAGLVRSRPQLFLEVLSAYKDLEHIKKFGYPVDFVGEGYESHPNALRLEYERRIAALESIKDPMYSKIKEGCIQKLRESINKYAQKAHFMCGE
jgi:hypothetical protein